MGAIKKAEYLKKYYLQNRERLVKGRAEARKLKRHRKMMARLTYFLTHKEEILRADEEEEKQRRQKRKDHQNQRGASYRLKNRERIREQDRNNKKLARTRNPDLKLLGAVRSRVNGALGDNLKSAPATELLGMSLREYRIYLQGQFRGGMCWENYGIVWEIDHLRPCDKFDLSDPSQQRECFNWSNTQPLLVEENLKKGSK